MRSRVSALITSLAVLLATLVALPAPASAAPLTKVLVFSKTAGFRHSSIPNGIAAIRQLGTANGFTVTATEDAAQFTTANLAQYQAVVFLSTTGDVLNASQQSAFESYIAAGGGYVGVHAAADTEYSWPWYGGLVGAWFHSHPAIQSATIRVEDRTNPSTAHLADTWVRSDEWYNYRTNPRPNVRVLASLDESSYSGGNMGDHPITWCRAYGGGRAWYTGLGHTEESYTDPNFTRMLLGGLRVAAGAVTADCTPRTTPPPSGTSLRARANNQYVSAPNATTALIANRSAVGATERFDLVDLGGGNVALRAKANGMYVAAENAGAAALIANRAAAGAWETFQLVRNSDGTVSLRALVNNRYVVAENAGAAALIANRTAIGQWEKFDLVTG
ncbi:ThuA domain-containing protein [Micromonospora cremea]|uniref:Type 1 glutamine amidotransferase (GATase1) n=1 Tax=Micromonospora cremea TaxID=709881 RepID=A0A1N5UKA1_9ACTN|nr:ThuA domain-containing protein [Micromonospora cremea]SIM60797.1 Type 1 glutamine amidotransferase (GATase1) [Micromonospora cremea]